MKHPHLSPQALDIAPFALPNCAQGEIRWEEPRDISRIIVRFGSEPAGEITIRYQRHLWPHTRVERDYRGIDNAMVFGWGAIDDWFNTPWVEAAIIVGRLQDGSFEIRFQELTAELPDCADVNVEFRRTLGLQIEAGAPIEQIEVFTRWQTEVTELEVHLDCGGATPGRCVALYGYNAEVSGEPADRCFPVSVRHLAPEMAHAGDRAHLRFELEHDQFTISLDALEKQGPIWYEPECVFIKRADDPTSFTDYQKSIEGASTLNKRVAASHDQGLGGALMGQPRAHPTSNSIGCKYARQRYWVEYNGDIVMTKSNMQLVSMSDTPRYKGASDARLFFGLESWRSMGRFADPAPVLTQNLHFVSDGVVCEQKSFAYPLLKSIEEPLVGDDSIIAMVRLRFRNDGMNQTIAELPLEYSSSSSRSCNRTGAGHADKGTNDYLVSLSEREPLTIEQQRGKTLIYGQYDGQNVLRFAIEGGMKVTSTDKGILLSCSLPPGESCDAVVKLPFIALDQPSELDALQKLSFDTSYQQLRRFWNAHAAQGAQLHTPEARLNELHAMHTAHVATADISMNDEPYLVNTSVGSSTYGNFTNESVMILQELDERGLHSEVRRRLAVWLKYQGQLGLKGNFSDHDGVFYAAGGFEMGETYSQHHGWALWGFSEHYFMTCDEKWLMGIAPQLIKGAEWVFRQRRLTMGTLPHSRGWEHGFMPAASLEDVTDYFYWLTTNTMSWKGVDRLAAALEACSHPEAPRLRQEADAFKVDLLRGFHTARQHSPVVRLCDGRWVPHFPSRLYSRGRDSGWIRELLEGSVYLVMMGLIEPNSKQAGWILDDYQDNRYISDDYGYPIFDVKNFWYDSGGFSCQPNLLAGLMPHLDRDEVEIYIWMFFNAWAACYREESNVMVEHPMPVLGQSNSAWVKTSDQANSQKWLRYMFVYAPHDVLYIGRAVPREWLKSTKPVGVSGAATRFGKVSALYTAMPAKYSIWLDIQLDLQHSLPERIIARFRHPSGLPIQEVRVNGMMHPHFDPISGDVDITGFTGKVGIEARYASA